MNLEEKAYKYAEKFKINEQHYSEIDFKSGYHECKSDIQEFIKANPKASVKQILEYLEGVK